MAEVDWRAQVRKTLEEGGGELVGERRFLPLVTLESGARCGLDPAGAWVLIPGDGRAPLVFAESEGHLWHEPLEWKRTRFEAEIEQTARAHDLPVELSYSFPAVEVIRAVLAKRSSYLTRLALEWLLPSELRELRREILEVTVTPNMPVAVKDLAARLVVPE